MNGGGWPLSSLRDAPTSLHLTLSNEAVRRFFTAEDRSARERADSGVNGINVARLMEWYAIGGSVDSEVLAVNILFPVLG